MSNQNSNLTQLQAALKQSCLLQLAAVQTSMKILQALPASQRDKEALADAAELVGRATVGLKKL